MFSEKAMNIAEACRFCWMCRHICPVGSATGKEVDTPRAKGLLVSMAGRGFEIDSDMGKVMYECALCGACTNDCATGYEPPVFIREARTQALINGAAPKRVADVIDTILETGSMFGAEAAALHLPATEGAKTLLWLGQTAIHRTPEIARALCELLDIAGIGFSVLEREPDSAAALSDLMGYVEDARSVARKCAETINAANADTLIVLDTYDADAFLHRYADWGVTIKPRIVTATAFVAELVASGKLRFMEQSGAVTYHDPSRLARDLDEHEPARTLVGAMGFDIIEMFLNRRMAKCCGNAVLEAYDPELTGKLARERWADAVRTGAGTLITACPQAYFALSASVPEGMKLKDVFVMLSEAAIREG